MLAIAALIAAIYLEVVAYRGGAGSAEATNVIVTTVSPDLGGVRLRLATRFGLVDRAVHVVAFPIGEVISRTSILVFNDPALPYAGGSFALMDAVKSDVAALASVDAPDISVGRVDSAGLVSTLRDTGTASSTAILILGGTVPMQTFSKKVNLITPWVDSGGLLVWAGDAIGYYSVSPGDHLDPTNSKNLQAAGSKILLGAPLVSFPTAFGRMGAAPSPIAAALQLRYSQTSSGLVTSMIDGDAGLDLGFRGDAVTSIAFRPHGRGGYLLFGGRVGDPVVVADDIIRILFSNILVSKGGLATLEINPTGTAVVTSTLHVDLPLSVHRVMLVATGSDTYPFFINAVDVVAST